MRDWVNGRGTPGSSTGSAHNSITTLTLDALLEQHMLSGASLTRWTRGFSPLARSSCHGFDRHWLAGGDRVFAAKGRETGLRIKLNGLHSLGRYARVSAFCFISLWVRWTVGVLHPLAGPVRWRLMTLRWKKKVTLFRRPIAASIHVESLTMGWTHQPRPFVIQINCETKRQGNGNSWWKPRTFHCSFVTLNR